MKDTEPELPRKRPREYCSTRKYSLGIAVYRYPILEAQSARIAFPEDLGLSRAVSINYLVLYPTLPASLVSKFAIWFHLLA